MHKTQAPEFSLKCSWIIDKNIILVVGIKEDGIKQLKYGIKGKVFHKYVGEKKLKSVWFDWCHSQGLTALSPRQL